ncbi:MAG: methyltransferase regulatory domain-containing protein [Deltaproteobacteria bacterium]|nr:methyltransferase regulatory domain-containing protein [Deltaproteobacteria bacterium]
MSDDAANERISDAYDRFPYPEYAFWFTHPDQLAAMATVFGLTPPPVATCRVLDVGCAVGGNSLPMAAQLPGAQVVGVDLSALQIARARASAAELGLDNVTFHHGDFRDLPDDGPFDYIVAHGLYSWVPRDVRDALLAFIGARLAPNGVAYVSYNTLPGWHTAGVVRDLVHLHTATLADPMLKVEQARAITGWLADRANRHDDDWRAGFLLAETANMSDMPAASVFHDYLAPDHEAVYFSDFVAHAGRFGLAYLSDAKPWDMLLDNLDADVAAALANVEGLVKQLQYVDFVAHRRFRQTLLCRAEAPVDRRVSGTICEGLHVHGALREDPGLEGLEAFTPVTVGNANRAPVEVKDTVARLALARLWHAGRASLSFDALATAVADDLAARALLPELTPAGLRRRLGSQLLRLFFAELVGFATRPTGVAAALPARPRVSPLARWQLGRDRFATNLAHEHTPFDEEARALALRLDGSRAAAELVAEEPANAELLARFVRGGFFASDDEASGG